MKRTILLLTAVLACAGLYALPPDNPKVEIYYFHFTRRCATCLNVEKVAKESLESLYPEQVKMGGITFLSINLDEKEGKTVGEKLKIEGQTLVVLCGEKRIDLTDKGFLYANANPEKLKEEIRKAVEGLLE